MNIYNFKIKDNEGNVINFNQYKGKVILIVNTATGCGYTPQYNGLQELYDKYKDKGLEILDFPCNQFGEQAPGTDAEISDFCEINFGVSFKQFSKIEVNGENEHPLYTYLKSQMSAKDGPEIKWNFTKFLINKEGEVEARFPSDIEPSALDSKIVELLNK